MCVAQKKKWLKENEKVDSDGFCKSLHEAILYENEDHIPVTVWENLLDEPIEETLYLFQNISLKNYYYGSKLTTAKSTIVSDERGVPYTLPYDAITNLIELDKKCNSRLHRKLCCPEVAAVALDVFQVVRT